MILEKMEDNTLTKMFVGRAVNRDEFWITVIKYTWVHTKRDAIGHRQTPEGNWVRFEPYEQLEPTMCVSGQTIAYSDPAFQRDIEALIKESRERDEEHSARIVDTLRKVLA